MATRTAQESSAVCYFKVKRRGSIWKVRDWGNELAETVLKLEVPCDEAGVRVRQAHVLDGQVLLADEHAVPVDVALGMDRHTRLLVTDEAGHVGKTVEVELVSSTLVRRSDG